MTTSFQSLLSEMNVAIARADQIILEGTELLNMLNKKENTMNDYDRIKAQITKKVDKPTLQEVIRDIEVTKAEVEAYRKIKEGLETLSTMPELSSVDRRMHHMNSIKYADLERRCGEFLQKIEQYKKDLENENNS